MVVATFPPYAPSAAWWCRWLASLIKEKLDSKEAVVATNRSLEVGRDLARTSITMVNGEELLLSIAIEGGARQLRDYSSSRELLLSDHGNWRHNHPSALEAAYGKTPFYPHLAPLLNMVFENRRLKSLNDFNTAIYNVLKDFLLGNLEPADLLKLPDTEAAIRRGKEIAAGMKKDVSIIDPLMKFGPEAVFGLFALNN